MGASPYTRERLTEAAAASGTLTETLERLGVDPRSGTRRYLRERMRKLEVDTSHFATENGARWTRDRLAEAVAASTNMCEVLQHLGLAVVGGNHTHISRRVRSMGIDTSHFVRSAKGERLRLRWRRPEERLVRQDPATARRVPGDRLKRALLSIGVPERCARCGQGPQWRRRPLPLEVDHIDGDWRDNRARNLRLLCPNCHAATDTYRGRANRRAAA
ncbi:HNH endonuclease [Streptomyces sp. NPDC051940]|uniref:HNH endonuclease signature motif containing protein n=1 Tax=Streptomyces sp. NPDC051940 TaxID=3155675 RepID=UPI00341D167D